MSIAEDRFRVEPDDVERCAIVEIDDLIDRWRSAGKLGGPSQWTTDVKTRFCRLGRKLGYKVCVKKGEVPCDEHDYGEWLYDATWLRYDEGEYLLDCPLVLESENEQDDDSIWSDWQKLIIANAAHRVMLFGKPSNSDRTRVFMKMIDEVDHYEQRRHGDRYLLAGWSDEGEGTMEYVVHLVGMGTLVGAESVAEIGRRRSIT